MTKGRLFLALFTSKTVRVEASVGVHTGANFITISIFDLCLEQSGQVIPAGILQPNRGLETLSIDALQLPWVVMAVLCSVVTYI